MEEESMMMAVRPPRGMTARQVTMLRRLYTMHIEQQEAIFAQPPSPAPATEAVVTATRAEARKATCRICFSETYAPDGRERSDEKPRPDVLIAPCKCDGSQKWVHVGCLRRWQRQIGRDNAGALPAIPRGPPQRPGGGAARATTCNVCNAPFALAPPRAKDMWEDLRAGCLLVARDHDRFSEKGGFRKSVILVLELTRTQAVGVCLASALGETAARQGPMWKDVDDDVKAAAEEAASSTIHWRRGGPVGGGRIGAPRFLVVGGAGETLRLDDGSAVDVLGGLRADDLPEALAEADHAVAVYKGYCRWGRQQLAQEFEGGDWDIVDSRRDDVAPQLIGEGLWAQCRRRINTS